MPRAFVDSSFPVSGTMETVTKGQIMRNPKNNDGDVTLPGDEQTALRSMPFVIALPFTALEAIGRAAFYTAWHCLYFVACAFRAFMGFLVIGGLVMLPVSLGVFIRPDAAPMPWWFFLASALGMFALATGYNLFLGWFAPPNAVDPFDRYRPSLRQKI
jgi:hypothetical protein